MLKTRLPTASVPFSLNALAKNLPAATLSSQRRETLGGVDPQGTQPLLDEPEVCPEDMGDNRIGAGDVDDRRKQLPHGQSRAAEVGRQPQRAEAGAFECDDLIKGVLVVEVSVLGSGGDLAEQSVEPVGAG